MKGPQWVVYAGSFCDGCLAQDLPCVGLSSHNKCLACMHAGTACKLQSEAPDFTKIERLACREDIAEWPEYRKESRAPYKRTKHADYISATESALKRGLPDNVSKVVGAWAPKYAGRTVGDCSDVEADLRVPRSEVAKEDVPSTVSSPDKPVRPKRVEATSKSARGGVGKGGLQLSVEIPQVPGTASWSSSLGTPSVGGMSARSASGIESLARGVNLSEDVMRRMREKSPTPIEALPAEERRFREESRKLQDSAQFLSGMADDLRRSRLVSQTNSESSVIYRGLSC